MASLSSDRMDVLLLLGPVQLRGSYSRAISLANCLLEERIDLKLVTQQPLQDLCNRLKATPTFLSAHLHRRLVGMIARRCLVSDLKRCPPTLIDIQNRSIHPAGSWLARRMRCPYVVTVHDYLQDRERFSVDRDWCRRVIAVSDSVRGELLERSHLREEQVIVIPTGVIPPPESELQPILTSDHAPVIGTAGPLEAGKGLQYFLRAASQVLKLYPDAMFLIAGSGPEERCLRRLATELGVNHAVSILPNLRDFNAALQAMVVFVLPALKQGLGSIMLDAMARRLPVIATESGGVFSVVSDGTTGLLIPPSDEHALAERIRFLLEHPDRARELGTSARQRVLEHFQFERMIKSTIDVYREITAFSRVV